MRHRSAGRRLGRVSSHRKALIRTMVTEFLENERIETTLSKAKELRPIAEKMITLGKREDLHSRRQALAFIRKKSVVHKLFDALAPRFADRKGGYTRIIKLGLRKGDATEVAILELIDAAAVAQPAASEGTKARKGSGKSKKTEAEGSEKESPKAKAKPTAKKAPAKKSEAKKAPSKKAPKKEE